jgi:hypothetical protein
MRNARMILDKRMLLHLIERVIARMEADLTIHCAIAVGPPQTADVRARVLHRQGDQPTQHDLVRRQCVRNER